MSHTQCEKKLCYVVPDATFQQCSEAIISTVVLDHPFSEWGGFSMMKVRVEERPFFARSSKVIEQIYHEIIQLSNRSESAPMPGGAPRLLPPSHLTPDLCPARLPKFNALSSFAFRFF